MGSDQERLDVGGGLAEQPDDATGWHRLAGALIGAEEQTRAVEAADRSIAVDPQNATAHRMRAIELGSSWRCGSSRSDLTGVVILHCGSSTPRSPDCPEWNRASSPVGHDQDARN